VIGSPPHIHPPPIATKAGPVLTHERVGTNDRKDLHDKRKPAIHLDKEPAIVVREPGGGRVPYGAKIID